MSRIMRVLLFCISLLSCFFLNSCGRSGPLQLPQQSHISQQHHNTSSLTYQQKSSLHKKN